jgi:hypothetical protein
VVLIDLETLEPLPLLPALLLPILPLLDLLPLPIDLDLPEKPLEPREKPPLLKLRPEDPKPPLPLRVASTNSHIINKDNTQAKIFFVILFMLYSSLLK